jgi:aspartyl-tRNA(Asn)/glutamyl-tRNA(Gln) amidotransferase subunit B
MEEGSLRCDVNLSVNRPGEPLGVRSEIKNMNSLSFMEKAMAYEYERHVSAIKNNEPLIQETRRFNESDGSTSAMRDKVDANDYRYFHDPDSPYIIIDDNFIDDIAKTMPMLPEKIKETYLEMGISEQDANLIIKYKKVADYFSLAIKTGDPKILSTYMLGEIFRSLETESQKESFDILVPYTELAELSNLQKEGKINAQMAKKTLAEMLKSGKSWKEYISKSDMEGIDESTLISMCKNAINENPTAVNDFKGGKEKALKALIGAVMRQSRGKANAVQAEQIILDLIK